MYSNPMSSNSYRNFDPKIFLHEILFPNLLNGGCHGQREGGQGTHGI